MPIDFRNTNMLWASVLVETLVRLGLKTAVICPGSRSAPLAIAFAQHGLIEAIPVLDERSASFFALGLARQTGRAIALVCTSGTAGANFYPAVIEARESRVPLLVLTADRPPELRACHAGQAIDQVKLFGGYPNWHIELGVPALDERLLAYLRQTVVQAWGRSHSPTPGPVHLNCPFREPLAPLADPMVQAWAVQFPETFFEHLVRAQSGKAVAVDHAVDHAVDYGILSAQFPVLGSISSLFGRWRSCERGVILAGPAQPSTPRTYCQAIAHFSRILGWPVLADGLSPLRNYDEINPWLISTYDLLLRNPDRAEALRPTQVIQMGELPTSKEVRLWLTRYAPERWVIDPSGENFDPLHGPTHHLHGSVGDWRTLLVQSVLNSFKGSDEGLGLELNSELNSELDSRLDSKLFLEKLGKGRSPYLENWCNVEVQIRQKIDHTLETLLPLHEPKAAWLLSQILPKGTPLFISNSMPVRDVEWFWKPGDRQIRPFCNRGANGIDGTLSTALGVAHGSQPSVLLTGDLAFLHDTNGCLLRPYFRGHLTIVLVNNEGGGIFEMLPIRQFDPPFEEFFATPQQVEIATLCSSYGIAHEVIVTWEQFCERISVLPESGIRVLEVKGDRQADSQWRHQLFATISEDSELEKICLVNGAL